MSVVFLYPNFSQSSHEACEDSSTYPTTVSHVGAKRQQLIHDSKVNYSLCAVHLIVQASGG